MPRHRCSLLPVVVAVLACAPVASRDDTTAAGGGGPSEAFLDSAASTFLSAMRAKDPAPIKDVYAEDAISYPPNAEPLRGKAAIAEYNKQWFASIEPDSVAAERDGLLSSGDIAVETGWYYFKGKMFGQPGEDRGRYLQVWQRQADGSWKIVRDIANSSIPIAAPAATPGSSRK